MSTTPARSLIEDLAALEALFTPEGTWIQGPFAQRADGSDTSSHDPAAVAWCLGGGINRVMQSFTREDQTLAHAMGFTSWIEAVLWNETPGRSREQVLGRIQEARSRLTAEPSHGA